MGVTFAIFLSSGTSPFAMLSTKISLSGDAMKGATSRNIVELKLSTPGALCGYSCNNVFNITSVMNSIYWEDSSIVLVKIFTGSGVLSVTSSVNTEAK